MAQTKRKRTRKHRGTPAGTIDRAGRTGRPQTREDAKQISRQRRQDRLDRPPTWSGAVNRAAIAAAIRESATDTGMPGVRAIGLLVRGRAQVSTNVHDHLAVPLAEIVERVRARAPVAEAELIGLAPRAAFDGFPEDVPLHGFMPERHILEEALAVLP